MNDDLERLLKELEKFRPAQLPSVLDRCVMVAKAKRLYREAYPETLPGGNRASSPENRQPKFSTFCSKVMGKSESSVELDVKIGNGLSQATYILLKDAPVADVQSVLHDLAGLDGTEQLAVAYMMAKESASSVNEALSMVSKSACELDRLL